jgi:hypothetical protein
MRCRQPEDLALSPAEGQERSYYEPVELADCPSRVENNLRCENDLRERLSGCGL